MDWTKQHEIYLKQYYGKKSNKEIANALERSCDSVQRKAQRLGLTTSKENDYRPWTKEEIDYMYKWYERRGTDFIAKKFNRTQYSVRRKAQNLGLNAYVCCELYVRTVANCFNSDPSVINRWIDKFGLPYITVKRGQLVCKLIDAKVFWKWAKNNKDIIPWQKYELQTILPEPEWLNEVIKNTKSKNTRKSITNNEKFRVRYLRNKGKSFKEIANELGRTVESVKHIWRSTQNEQGGTTCVKNLQ
jgi:DNA-binding CsgD family transcriptional regulator